MYGFSARGGVNLCNQNQDEPFLKSLALACLCSAVAKNLVVSELPPAPCPHHTASYGCKAFKKKNPCASARKTLVENLTRKTFTEKPSQPFRFTL